MNSEKPRNFGEFWPYYVLEHLNPKNRRSHFIGTTIGFILLAIGAVSENPWFLLGALVSGYGFAWFGHFFIERNRPATFRHPIYSLLGDFKMFYLILNRKMDAEVDRIQRARQG